MAIERSPATPVEGLIELEDEIEIETEDDDLALAIENPESISMDNLVQLWRFQNGQADHVQHQAPSIMPAEPSPAFQQTQRAQQVPPTMGVVSGQGNSVDPTPAGQKFMEALIGTHNDNKAF